MKKILSLAVTLLLLINTIYIPAFAVQEIVLPEDEIVFYDSTLVICDDNFDRATVGADMPGVINVPYQRDNASLSASPNYLSFKYANGIGENETKTLSIYDRGHIGYGSRVKDDGSADTGTTRDSGRNRDAMGFANSIIGDGKVTTSFRFYNAGNNMSGSSVMDTLTIRYAKENAPFSSTTPTVNIYATYAELKGRVGNDLKTMTITGLQPKTWYDCVYEVYYEPASQKAIEVLTINGQTVETEVSNPGQWMPNGYDEPYHVLFSHDYRYGGRFYIDDLKITKSKRTQAFETVVNNFTFNAVVSGDTANIQSDVNESWPGGLITSYKVGTQTYDVEWKSSDPSAISPDGTVTKRSYAQTVKLTAKIKQSETVYAERTFTVVVSPSQGAPVDVMLSEYAEFAIKESAFSDEVTDASNKITKNIKPLPTRDDIAGMDIRWESSDSSVINPETGEVIRPSYESSDAVVTLTAYISKDGSEPVTKTITYTVAKRSDPRDAINETIAYLEKNITSELLTKVTGDLNLPETYGDVTITWDTSGHSQIDTDGTVTRGENEVTAEISALLLLDGVEETKTFEITVYPTVERMLELDVEAIDKTGWDAITSDFTVPLIGSKYSSVLSWTSTSNYVTVGEGGKITVKRPSNAHTEDLSLNLIVNAKLEGAEKDIPVPVVVLRQADDITTAAEVAATINFDTIKGANSAPDNITNQLVLIDGLSSDKEISITWVSSNESVVTPKGEVIRPLPEEGDKEVTLTANVKKNYATAPAAPITVTVKALANYDELLNDAKCALDFAVLSSEEIDAVTENLYLPDTGRYGTTITWSVDSKFAKFLNISGTEGIITRPGWDELTEPVLLTATITYQNGSVNETAYKSFNITILEQEILEINDVIINENFNSWTESNKFKTAAGGGSWKIPPAVTGSKADIDINPDGSDNNVIYITRKNDSEPSYLSYTAYEEHESSAFDVSMSLFVPEDFTGEAVIDVFSTGTDGSLGYVVLNGATSKITVKTAPETMLDLAHGSFTKGVWNRLKYDINTKTKKFHLYLNGNCITENGYVTVQETGKDFVTLNGIPYSTTTGKKVKGVRWTTDSGTLYIDDLYMNKYSAYTEDHKRAIEMWEAEFYSTVDTSCIKNDFYLPKLSIPGMTITVRSGNGEILNTRENSWLKYYTPVKQVTEVTIYMTFDNGKTAYEKGYVCYVYPPDGTSSSVNTAELAKADLNTVVNYLKSNYVLENLKDDLNLAGANHKNGSVITYQSSNESVLSNAGKITKGDEKQRVELTITATNGTDKKSETLVIYVGTRALQNNASSGGPVGGGGGSKPPVSGQNTNPQSGIEITQPEDENKENQGSASAFTDVAKDHWAYDHINYMVENKIMNGVGDGRIEPERTINREEFVKMLVVTLGLDLKDAKADFTDVDKNEWYAPYVATIKEKGLILGYEDGTFGIGQNISRQDLAVLIYRSASLAKEEMKDVFADDAEIADYAKDAVYTLRDLGIINGKDDGKFEPSASATRAETATMLYKAIKAGLFE